MLPDISLSIAAGRSSSSDREPIQSNSAVSDGWQVRCNCGATDGDGKPMVECEGGCKIWVHLKCHKIKAGQDWFCDTCLAATHTSKAHSDDVDHCMDEPADAGGASPSGSVPTSGDSALGAKSKSRAAVHSPIDTALNKAASTSPGLDRQCFKAVASSPNGSESAADIEVDLTADGSPQPRVSSKKKSNKVNSASCCFCH